MSNTDVLPLTQTSRLPVCHDCGWEGAPTSIARAHQQAGRHECDPADVEAYRRKQQERAGEHAGRVAGGTRGIVSQQQTAGLEFTGTLKNVQMVAPKEKNDYMGQRLEGGSLVITLEVPRPALPSAPKPDYRLARYKPFGGHMEPPAAPGSEPANPDELEQKDGEAEEAFQKRVEKASKAWDKWEAANRAFEDYTEAAEEHLAEVAEYERKVEGIGGTFAAWMHLAGVGAVLQGMPVSISLSPDNSTLEKYLPGFSPALALSAPPAEAVPAEQEAAG